MRISARSRFQESQYLARFRVAAKLRFLEDRRSVARDLEPSATGRPERHVRAREMLPQLGRQTDGPGFVASNGAVLDLDIHGIRIISIPNTTSQAGDSRQVHQFLDDRVLLCHHELQGVDLLLKDGHLLALRVDLVGRPLDLAHDVGLNLRVHAARRGENDRKTAKNSFHHGA
jgi:hypothetical protein